LASEEFLRRLQSYVRAGDPMDRIITATAMVEGVPLVTADRNIRRSRLVKTIW